MNGTPVGTAIVDHVMDNHVRHSSVSSSKNSHGMNDCMSVNAIHVTTMLVGITQCYVESGKPYYNC